MHEMALTESMVEIALEEARKAGAARVQRIVLDVGALSAVAPEAMMFCFSAVSAGTAAEGAELVIERVEGAGWCPDCEKSAPLAERYDACPYCGGYKVQITEGGELRIREMEVV